MTEQTGSEEIKKDEVTNEQSIIEENQEEEEEEEQADPQLEGTFLSCAGRDLTDIPPALGDTFGADATSLDLSYNLLKNLSNLEKFTNLTSLILDNNQLDDNLEFPSIPSLDTLSLNNNKIETLDFLITKIKTSFPNVRYLSLLKNPACPNLLVGGDEEEYKRYRMQIIYQLPNIKFLDSGEVTVPEKKEAKRIGPYLKVARPTEQPKPQTKETETEEFFPPLPSELAGNGEHRGTFGISKYVYYGKHSEGNRFIKNDAL